MSRIVVGPSPAYTRFRIAGTILGVVLTAGILLLFVPYLWLHHRRVTMRTTIEFVPGAQRVLYHRGRITTLDDDAIAASAIDNVKIDRTVLGSMFGWCHVEMSTRTETYRLRHADMEQATAFRNAVFGLSDAGEKRIAAEAA